MIKPKVLDSFLQVATKPVAYTVDAKRLFHLRGTKLLKQIAIDLGLPEGSYEVRSNKGGIAVSGEVTLHGDTLYVQLSQSVLGIGRQDVLFRTCKGRRDYTGGRNNFMAFTDLRQYNGALARLTQIKDNVMFMVIPND